MLQEEIFASNNENQEVIQGKEDNSATGSKKKIMVTKKGEWGERLGNNYIFSSKAKKKINVLNGETVYCGLTYKKCGEKVDENNQKIVILKLVGQEQKIEFHKDELYKNFGVQSRSRGMGRKARYVGCTDEEYRVLKSVIIPLLRDEKYCKILGLNGMIKIKEVLSQL